MGSAGATWLLIKEARRSDEQLRAGTGGAVSAPAGMGIVLLFLPYIFFSDLLPEIPDRLVAGILCGGALAAAVGVVALGRLWRKRGF